MKDYYNIYGLIWLNLLSIFMFCNSATK